MIPTAEPAARDVAAAYSDACSGRGRRVSAPYARLVTESDRLFRRLTSPHRPDRVRIAFTACPAPCADADELIRSVNDDRLLDVTTVATNHEPKAILLDPRLLQRSVSGSLHTHPTTKGSS